MLNAHPDPRSPRPAAQRVLLCSALLTLGGSIVAGNQPTFAAPLGSSDGVTIAQNVTGNNYNLIFVNSQQGSDSNNGSAQAPLKTITQALTIAPPNTVIVLAPGIYSSDTGEQFPLQLKPEVTIQGEPRDRGQNVVIRGSGWFLSKSFARQKVTIVGSNRAGLRGITVSNPEDQGYGLWIESSSPVISDSTFTGSGHDGVSIVGNSAPILKNNYFYSNGANGITIYGTSRPELRDNIFEKTGFGINIAQNAAPRIIGNRITQNKDGIVVQGNASPILRGNVIDGNDRDGLVAIANARPDLGTTSDQGNNTFLSNGQSDVNAKASSQIVPAAGNQIGSRLGRVDLNAVAIAAAPVPTRQPLRPNPVVASTPRSSSPAPSTSIPLRVPAPTPAAATSEPPLREITFSRPTAPSNSSGTVATPVPSTPATPTSNTPLPPLIPVAVAQTAGARSLPQIPRQFLATTPLPQNTLPPSSLAIGSSSDYGLTPNRDVLKVPSGNIPLGNVGSMPSVAVWQAPSRRAVGGPPMPPTRSGLPPVTVKFRVVAELADEALVKSIVPDAFTTSSGGRSVLQAGAFSDQSKANELLQTLISRGIRASLEQF